MRKYYRFLFVAMAGILASCASFKGDLAWSTKGGALPRGLRVEIGRSNQGSVASGAPLAMGIVDGAEFRIGGEVLEGAVVEGEARRVGESWELEVTGLAWFNNWAEGWTEARFDAEGKFRVAKEGERWRLAVIEAPKLGSPRSASMRLYGDYFSGDKALALFTNRWDRILAVTEHLAAERPGLWYDYSVPTFRIIRLKWERDFQSGSRAYLFPELYGYAKGERPARGHATARAESVDWDVGYTAAHFPEELRELRDSGTMLRDFEECPGLWRLALCWDELWAGRAVEAIFIQRRGR